jgi:hypothetical protein
MLGLREIGAVEKRAAAARLTMGELCSMAGVAASTWSRAKARGKVRVSTVRRLEEKLAVAEAPRCEA